MFYEKLNSILTDNILYTYMICFIWFYYNMCIYKVTFYSILVFSEFIAIVKMSQLDIDGNSLPAITYIWFIQFNFN